MPRKKTNTRKKASQGEAAPHSKFKQDVIGILLIALGIFVFTANLSSSTGLLGLFVVKTLMRSAIGIGVLVLPLFIGLYGLILLLRHEVKELTVRLMGILLLFFDYIAVAQFMAPNYFGENAINFYFAGAGGAVGYAAQYVLTRVVGLWGSYIVMGALGFIGLLMLSNVTVLALVDFIKGLFVFGERKEPCLPAGREEDKEEGGEKAAVKAKPVFQLPLPIKKSLDKAQGKEEEQEEERGLKAPLPPPPPVIISSTVTREEKDFKDKKEPYLTLHKEPTIIQEKVTVVGDYELPPLSMLEDQTLEERKKAQDMQGQINSRKEQLEKALRDFGIGAHVTAIFQGPAVTRYELQPEPGVKVSRIHALSNDISLAMATQGIRIEAPVPGKSVVGIEVPNSVVTPVRLKEIASSKKFQNHPSKLAFCIGKDLSGAPIIGDLECMPHLLIAGTTGSGKSVCLNSIITSFLLRTAPNELKFIMIDPKMVELSVYNGIAHLLTPVVTNVKKAAMTLKVWVLQEMNRRYELFHGRGARNIAAYNKKMGNPEDRLPYLVVIVDELADLMMAAANEVEQSICRIAQMARATGIHMIIATQRPSVDVITGLIKANIPSRIAFAVATQIDSRVILDTSGAEKLLGKGDMLYNPIGAMKPTRAQGCYLTDKEIDDVVGHVQNQCEAEYIEEIQTIKALDLDRKGDGGGLGGPGESAEDGKDVLFGEVAKLIVATGQASTSYIQRKFRIGYNRAARLMDEMEAAGIVSAPEGENKPRRILANTESLAGLGVS